MKKTIIITASVFGLLAVIAGAFGAHALKQRISGEMLTVFEVGARYQMYHALALILVAIVYTQLPDRFVMLSGWFFVSGILLFSGSLYLLALTGIRVFGAITPIGGLLLLFGWGSLIFSALKN